MDTQYISDDKGKKVAVILPIKSYHKIMKDVEELDDIRLYDKLKKENEESLPLNEAFQLIDEYRKKHLNDL